MKKEEKSPNIIKETPTVVKKDWSFLLDLIRDTLRVPIEKITFEDALQCSSSFENRIEECRGYNESIEYVFYGYDLQANILTNMEVKMATKKIEDDMTVVHPMFGPRPKRTVTGESETLGEWHARKNVHYDIVVVLRKCNGKSTACLRKMLDFSEEMQKIVESKRKDLAEWVGRNGL